MTPGFEFKVFVCTQQIVVLWNYLKDDTQTVMQLFKELNGNVSNHLDFLSCKIIESLMVKNMI